MKKLLCICAVVILLLSLNVAASAAGQEKVVLTPSVTKPEPGDLVEISISVTGSESVKGCRLMLDYDTNLFETVSGRWLFNIDGTFEDNVAEISWPEAENINGTVFVLKLRVRTEVTFGETMIQCNATVTDANGKPVWYRNVTPAQIIISSPVCQHTFERVVADDYLKAEATCTAPAEYYVSCAKCGASGESTFTHGEIAPHTFSEIIEERYLVSPASCTAEAVYKLSCAACGEMSEETFVYGEKLAHVLVELADEKYLDPANPGDCKTPPSYFLSCESCGEMGTVTFTAAEPRPHEYRQVTYDEYLATAGDCQTKPTYYVSCGKCGEAGEETFAAGRVGAHKQEFPCSTTCMICGKAQEQLQGHTGADTMSSDEQGHWTACTVCSEKIDFAAHIPGPEATPDAHQLCTVCGYVLAVHESHVCVEYVDEWGYDDEEHWHQCVQCGGKADKGYHIWEIVDDSQEGKIQKGCTVCAATKEETVPVEPDSTTEPTDPEPTDTLPTTSDNTVPDTQKKNDGKTVLLIVFGVLLGLSLIGNGVLVYFVITLAPKGKHVRK